MKRINNKGFTLVEVLAVVAILGMVMVIMIPNVNNFLAKEKDTNIERLKKSIIQAGKLYISDNKYEITLDIPVNRSCSINSDDSFSISEINGTTLTGSKVKIQTLIDGGYLTTDKNGKIKNPKNDSQCLKLIDPIQPDNVNYLQIIYMCNTKDYKYLINGIEEILPPDPNERIIDVDDFIWINC